MRFTIFQESRKGAREVNQDRLAYTYSRETLLLVIADGMGGHVGGEIAAQIAVRLFIERFQQEAKPILRNPLKFMQETMLRAHAALGSYANQFSMLETPRTTCVAVIVQGGHAYWSHVGDSRFYLLRQGKLIATTKDHSKVQYLVDQGLITPEEVVMHPDRNKIFSCLGGMTDPVIDLSRRTPIMNGDLLILCTDGLWSVYPIAEMATMLTSTPILTTAPQMMRKPRRALARKATTCRRSSCAGDRKRWRTSPRRRTISNSGSSRRRSTRPSRSRSAAARSAISPTTRSSGR